MPTPRKSWTFLFQQVIFKRDLQAGETAHPFFVGASALTDPFARRAAVDLFRVLRGGSPADLTSPEGVQSMTRAIQQAVSSGELVSVRRMAIGSRSEQNSGSGSSSAGTPPRRRSSNPPPASDNRSEKTWVEIRLIDDDGNPIPSAKYKLKITDGSVREGALDDDGRVRVNGIDPGSCTVWFPDYDGREWRPR